MHKLAQSKAWNNKIQYSQVYQEDQEFQLFRRHLHRPVEKYTNSVEGNSNKGPDRHLVTRIPNFGNFSSAIFHLHLR